MYGRVEHVEQLTPQLVRVVLGGEGLAGFSAGEFTDHYVKLQFPPPGAPYTVPYDADAVRALPREQQPVMRTYSVRSWDPDAGLLTIDFVVHGDEGLAGPWAATAEPGDRIGFFGPGGAYQPDPEAESHLLIGDEAALPAIAATLERLPRDAHVEVYLEVAGRADQQELPMTTDTTVHWVHRDRTGLDYGQALCVAVRANNLPPGRLQAFVHGNADMVKNLRRYLFVEHGLNRSSVSISGYWRTGHTEDRWQATKGDFNQQMEAEESITA